MTMILMMMMKCHDYDGDDDGGSGMHCIPPMGCICKMPPRREIYIYKWQHTRTCALHYITLHYTTNAESSNPNHQIEPPFHIWPFFGGSKYSGMHLQAYLSVKSFLHWSIPTVHYIQLYKVQCRAHFCILFTISSESGRNDEMALWQINPPSNYLWPSSIIIFKRHHRHCIKWSFSCQKIWYLVSVFQKVRQFVLVTFLITSLFSFNGTGNDFPWKKSFPQTCRLQRKLSNVLKIIRMNQIYDSIMIPPAHKGQNETRPVVVRCQSLSFQWLADVNSFSRETYTIHTFCNAPQDMLGRASCVETTIFWEGWNKKVFFVFFSQPNPQSQHSLSSINKERRGTSFTIITML